MKRSLVIVLTTLLFSGCGFLFTTTPPSWAGYLYLYNTTEIPIFVETNIVSSCNESPYGCHGSEFQLAPGGIMSIARTKMEHFQ